MGHREFSRLLNPELWQVRGWLYHCFGVKEYFGGDGLTVAADGKQYVKEYISSNFKVNRHPNFRWINMELKSNSILQEDS